MKYNTANIAIFVRIRKSDFAWMILSTHGVEEGRVLVMQLICAILHGNVLSQTFFRFLRKKGRGYRWINFAPFLYMYICFRTIRNIKTHTVL